MQCERCNKKKATVFYRENINGKARAFRLCGDCAAAMQQTGELEDLSSALTRFSSLLSCDEPLFGLVPIHGGASTPKDTEACPVCGMTAGDFRRTGQAGCAACYAAFASPPTVAYSREDASVNDGQRIPRRLRVKQERLREINELKAKLAEAISAERYEEAAALRDRIRDAEARP